MQTNLKIAIVGAGITAAVWWVLRTLSQRPDDSTRASRSADRFDDIPGDDRIVGEDELVPVRS